MKLKTLLLIFVFSLAFLVRFYDLGVIPDGLAQDETSIGYNAYSLVQTGRDEYGKPWPIEFKAFGEYKLPGYIYLAVPSISMFGPTAFAVRLPSAVFGFLTVVLFYFILKKLTKNEWLALLGTTLLALNPWHIHFSRAAFEVVPALFFLLAGVYLFLQFVDKKKYPYFIFSACFFVLAMYTYNTCRVLAPLLFVLLSAFYYKKLAYKKGGFWLSFIPALLLLMPFFWQVFFGAGFSSVKGTLIYASAPIQAQIQEIRELMFTHGPLFSRIFYNRWTLTTYEYLNHIVMYFSPTFFFVSGSEHGNHGIGNVGMFYLFELLTVLVGLVAYCRKPQRWLSFLLLWGTSVILVAAFTREVPHGTRGFFLIPTVIAFSAYGLYILIKDVSKGMILKRFVLGVLLLLIGFNLTYYFASYYFRFPLVYGKAWRSQDAALIDYIKSQEGKYDRIIFDEKAGFMYTSLLYYLPYNPQLFQQGVNRGPDDSEGFSKVHSFGKYSIGDIDWKHVKKQHKTLVITVPNSVPAKTKIAEEFVFPYRPILWAEGQNIIRPPIKDTAYVILIIK